MRNFQFSLIFSALGAFILVGFTALDASAQTCTGVGCSAQNTCSPVQAQDARNCCCQPQCGPGGCYACLQSCYLSGAYSQCPAGDNPLCGGGSAGASGFAVSRESIAAASEVERVAAIVLQGRSVGGAVPMYSELVTGGTNIFGDQIGFSANIIAESNHLTMDIAFNGGATLPMDVRFELDSSGAMSVSPLPPGARMQMEQALAARQMPCELVVAAATSVVR